MNLLQKQWDCALDYRLSSKDMNGAYSYIIPEPAKKLINAAIAQFDLKVAIYPDMPNGECHGVFGCWSPLNGGTLHINLKQLKNALWYNKIVLIKMSLAAHRAYRYGSLKIQGERVIWERKDVTGLVERVRSLYTGGFVLVAMQAIRDLPWFSTVIATVKNEEARSHHIDILEGLYA